MSCAQCPFPAFSRSASRLRRGFTLIEILSVVVILGIASAIIVPQLSSRDDLRCAAAARALMGDLLYAQSRSIALGKMQYVQFNTTTNTYQVLDAVNPNNVINNPVTQSPYTVTVGTGYLVHVGISTASFDGNTTVAFDPMGVPYSWSSGAGTVALTAGSIVFQAGTNKKTITVGPYSGEIKIN
ncbi:MAG TPA: GspH/FimT family pseudopilin [Tepidisphaeraceae bacterium]|nr:GspH/FimT family pseudopilin [Tepidisphaeraceae bacterium]